MRHASYRTTLDIYTQTVSQQKRDANAKVVEMMLPLEARKFQDPSGPSEVAEDFYKVFCRDIEIGEFDAEALRFRPVQVLPCFPAK